MKEKKSFGQKIKNYLLFDLKKKKIKFKAK